MAAKTIGMRNTDMGQPEMEMSQGNKLPDTPKDKKKRKYKSEIRIGQLLYIGYFFILGKCDNIYCICLMYIKC